MKPLKVFILAVIFITCSIAAYFLVSPGKGEIILERTNFLMGTIVQIKVSIKGSADRAAAERAIEKAFEEISRVEDTFSVFKKDSEVSRINSLGANETLKISDEAFDLIEKAIEYNNKTSGVFDITVKPLVDLWRAAKAANKLPDEAEIKAALARIGSQNIVLDRAGRTISFKMPGMAIDLGGVAKGYATDRAVKVLKENGIENAIVNAGGDMYCLGRRSAKVEWNVGIRHPRKKDGVLFRLKLQDKAIDTSGDYEKYFILNGRRYSHIIDPRTGMPVGDGVVSATVTAGDSTTADILATALCLLGREGLDTVRSVPGADALIVLNEGGYLKIEMTEGFERIYGITAKKAL